MGSESISTPWNAFAREMADVELSDAEGSVAIAAASQAEAARRTALEWTDVPRVHCPVDEPPAGRPAQPTAVAPSPDTLPIDRLAADPERYGFVELRTPAPGETATSGPLAGLSYARKDMFFRAGELSECGSPIMAGHRPETTASVVRALDAAGAVDRGRLHMAELAMSPTGRNNWWGPGRNPWNRDHASGGSSSGSGIAAASRAVDFTLGSDTGGSVRIPAAACGVTGIKPTQGVLPLDGSMPLSPSLDCLGVLAPAATTVSAVFEVLLGVEGARPVAAAADPRSTTVHVPAFQPEHGLDAGAIAGVDATARALSDAGYTIVPASVPDFTLHGQLATILTSVEAASVWGDRLSEDADQFYLEIRRRIERGVLLPGPVYLRAARLRRTLLQQFLASSLPEGDLLLLPTIPSEAPTVTSTVEGTPEELEARFAHFSYWTRGINYLGLPAVSVPSGFGPQGLPYGTQIVAGPYRDRTALAAAIAVQERSEWHTATPAVN